jgi:hypothetical protein
MYFGISNLTIMLFKFSQITFLFTNIKVDVIVIIYKYGRLFNHDNQKCKGHKSHIPIHDMLVACKPSINLGRPMLAF